MPHFGAPFEAITKGLVSLSELHASIGVLPMTVGVDPTGREHQICESLAVALGKATGALQVGFSLVTHNSPASLRLTNDQAHRSDPCKLWFVVKPDSHFPNGLGVVVGKEFVDQWTHCSWGLGMILSRLYIGCSPIT